MSQPLDKLNNGQKSLSQVVLCMDAEFYNFSRPTDLKNKISCNSHKLYMTRFLKACELDEKSP